MNGEEALEKVTRELEGRKLEGGTVVVRRNNAAAAETNGQHGVHRALAPNRTKVPSPSPSTPSTYGPPRPEDHRNIALPLARHSTAVAALAAALPSAIRRPTNPLANARSPPPLASAILHSLLRRV